MTRLRELTERQLREAEVERLTAKHMIPACTGHTALVVTLLDDDDYHEDEVPIVGWLFDHYDLNAGCGIARPILAYAPCSTQRIGILTAEGYVIENLSTEIRGRDEFITEMLADLRKRRRSKPNRRGSATESGGGEANDSKRAGAPAADRFLR
jgi:hypothetical protein